MTDEMMTTSETIPGPARRPRRGFLARAMGLGTAGLVAGLGARRTARAQAAAVTDPAILNFALNLEYLEAEYYTYAVTGQGIANNGVATNGMGSPGPTTVKLGIAPVPFATPAVRQLANELALDERLHVQDIRALLAQQGTAPVAKPAIDLLNSFNMAAAAAGLPTPFDPFANEVNFLIGAYIFEDVGVTAYHGAAPLIRNKDVLNYAAGIYAVEGYHAGSVRLMLNQMGQGAATDAISALRQKASGVTDYGVGDGAMDAAPGSGQSSIIQSDPAGATFARTTAQVLSIVYLNAAPAAAPARGGFFPNGFNGVIR